MEKQKDGE